MNINQNKNIILMLALIANLSVVTGQFCYAQTGREIVVSALDKKEIDITMEKFSWAEESQTIKAYITNNANEVRKLGPLVASKLFKNNYRMVATTCPSELPPKSQCTYSFEGVVTKGEEINSDTYVALKIYKDGNWLTFKRRPWSAICFLNNENFSFSRPESLKFKNIFPTPINITKVTIQGYGVDDGQHVLAPLKQNDFTVEPYETSELVIPALNSRSIKYLDITVNYILEDGYEELQKNVIITNKEFYQDENVDPYKYIQPIVRCFILVGLPALTVWFVRHNHLQLSWRDLVPHRPYY